MNFRHYDLHQQPAGALVEVTLSGTEANVLLLDSTNLQRYRAGREFRYFGGHTRRSPYSVTVPTTGHWHLVVDLGGASGTVRSSVQVFPPQSLRRAS